MKICFPVAAEQGLESTVYDHFGSARNLWWLTAKLAS